jgi:hypothetical protein
MTSRSKKSPAIISGRQLKLLPKPFTPGKPATGREIDHFEYFTVMCTGSLSGYFENPLWNKTILQISYSEPAIRNAVIALSSILRYHYTQAHSSIDRHEPALNYQNALQALNRRLDGSAISWELALLGSLLFTSFEALGGRDAGALQHLDAGLAVFDEYAMTHPVSSSSYNIVSNADRDRISQIISKNYLLLSLASIPRRLCLLFSIKQKYQRHLSFRLALRQLIMPARL